MQSYLRIAFNIFLGKIFKHAAKLEEIYSEYPYVHHLYFTVNILAYLPHHLSIYPPPQSMHRSILLLFP